MLSVLRAELRRCLEVKFFPTKTLVSASLEGERSNETHPVLSHTRTALESANRHVMSQFVPSGRISRRFLFLLSNFIILHDGFRFAARREKTLGFCHIVFQVYPCVLRTQNDRLMSGLSCPSGVKVHSLLCLCV